MSDPAAMMDWVIQALDSYFSNFARGMDVPPARRYFLEGYLQAMVDGGVLSQAETLTLIADTCARHFDDELANTYRSAEHLVLHSHMRRAPVYPSGG